MEVSGWRRAANGADYSGVMRPEVAARGPSKRPENLDNRVPSSPNAFEDLSIFYHAPAPAVGRMLARERRGTRAAGSLSGERESVRAWREES